MKTEAREPTNAETAILGLLAEGPKHPYQIEKDVEFRSMRQWTDLSMSSIYKLLKGLEQTPWVEVKNEQSGANRLRKVFRLTSAGRKAFRGALANLASNHLVAKNPFDLGLYFSDELDARAKRRAFKQYRKELEGNIDCYRELQAYLIDCGCPAGPCGLAARTVAMLVGELAWLDGHIKALGE